MSTEWYTVVCRLLLVETCRAFRHDTINIYSEYRLFINTIVSFCRTAIRAPPMLMNILECIQRHLGSIESWPSDILVYLFCCPPNESRLQAIAMFCYGNDVPLTIASGFYHFSNAASTPFEHEKLDHYYAYFQYYMYKHHMGRYYNMSARKFMYINGKCLNQTDEVIPQPPEQDFGIADTGCELLIRSKLQYITRDVANITV